MSVQTKYSAANLIASVPAMEGTGLERSRYFAGLLLTDAELTTDQHYFRERLRRHNRDLHGWGVVCGLEIGCDPDCAEQIIVHPGHAIDSRGDDIILFRPTPFNWIHYLKERAKQVEPDCGPYAKPSKPVEADSCAGAKREYCLVLSYNEEMTRPQTALMYDTGGKTNRCEPTRIRETVRLDLIERIHIQRQPVSPLLERLCTCIESVAKDSVLAEIWKKIGDVNQPEPGYDELYTLFCTFRDYVQDLYTQNPHNVRCNICTELGSIKFPTRGDNQYYRSLWATFARLYGYVAQYVLDCLCHALLSPCPECEPYQPIILACLTVDGDVLTHICNLARRWYPSPLEDKLMVFRFFQRLLRTNQSEWIEEYLLDDLLEQICCRDMTMLFAEWKPDEWAWEPMKKQLQTINARIQEIYQNVQQLVCERSPRKPIAFERFAASLRTEEPLT